MPFDLSYVWRKISIFHGGLVDLHHFFRDHVSN